jgi:hypothetical protein
MTAFAVEPPAGAIAIRALGGALRVVDSSVAGCKSSETSLAWGVVGPAGPRGPAGSDSTKTVFGAVNGNGTSQFVTDAFSVEHLGAGHYKLTFAPGDVRATARPSRYADRPELRRRHERNRGA